ncbi:FKBP-type peptidyl-prolyl cis-trans isomerase [Porphyromonas sp. COT-290 OH3588]|uniref:FKBP-type peptidyl-prolyl cis-trans isomerase n=1 Tax=Porphyromonas sp. COT-290 OH3588 TaxID=1515617 RepID=UPI00052DB064|nr:FKBP-type peptidyl-prolyl cis-trans isomerase [Porphyromonas sp. COT-290 OH3588]KGN97800.1 peptidylprolyl isomerase [Porphyromonas sp. COT-290 OH3588]
MKKFSVAVAALALVLGGFSCSQKAGNPSSGLDSMSYALGLLQGRQMAETIKYSREQGQDIDSMKFLEGFEKAVSNPEMFSYFAGGITGAGLARQIEGDSLNIAQLVSAYRAALQGDSTKITMNDSIAQDLMMRFGQMKQEKEMRKQAEENEKKFGANKQKGAEFIENFKKEEGVQTTESGLAYKVEQPGTGATPTAEDKVKVKYRGTLIDGTEFDKNEEGIEFPANGVIKGWTEMLTLMKVGEKVRVVIPYDLAYGEQGSYSIDPFSTLVFEIELLDIVK